MMRCPRFDRLAALAIGAGARVMRTGNGQFVAMHRGGAFTLANLRELAEWLVAIDPGRRAEIAHAGTKTAKLKRKAQQAAKRAARREASVRESSKSGPASICSGVRP